MPRRFTDAQVTDAVEKFGMGGAAKALHTDRRNLKRRVARITKATKTSIQSPFIPTSNGPRYIRQHEISPHRFPLTISDGVVVVAGDCHYWPNKIPFMHRALTQMLTRFREQRLLRAVIMNGDICDFGGISRYGISNWEKAPEVHEEIEIAQDRMHEIEKAAGKVPKLWPGGNHDIRFNNYIAAHADKLRNLKGAHLKDFFPLWQPCWSAMINEQAGFRGCTFVKHRIRGGVYAVRNNIIACGTHIVTNHLHASNVWSHTVLPGTLYGVDTGCIAEINSPQFLYCEDNPRNWREGFCVLTYKNGVLERPDLVERHPDKDDCILFRGEMIRVSA